MVIVTSEYVYKTLQLYETRNIVENILEEYQQMYGGDIYRSGRVLCNAEFLDKLNNEGKNVTIERYDINGAVNKIMQSSKGVCKFIKIMILKTIIEGKIFIKILNIYIKSGAIPILWKKFLMKIVNNRPDRLMRCSYERNLCKFDSCKRRKMNTWCVCLLVIVIVLLYINGNDKRYFKLL